MTRTVDTPLAHQEAWELIPWYVNGTLEGDEAERLEAHLERCPLCRREVEVSRDLALAVRDAGELPSPEPGLARVLERLDGASAPAPTPERRGVRRLLPSWWSSAPRPARRALAVQMAAVLLLTVALGVMLSLAPRGPEMEAGFRTLTAPDPAAVASRGEGFRVRLVFSPAATEPELRRLLLADGGRLVAGPSPAGVYTAGFPAGADPEAVLVRLRGAPQVELAEPAHGGDGP